MSEGRAPKLGDDVFYRLPQGRSEGEYRPAKIVRIWPGASSVQLQVFTDASNDGLAPVHWATSVVQGDGPGQYTYELEAV